MADLTKITLDTSRMVDLQSIALGGQPTYRGELKNLDKDLAQLERTIKSASNTFKYFNDSLKEIDTATGLAKQSFYVASSEVKDVMAALRSKTQEMSQAKGALGAFRISQEDMNVYSTERTIYGTRAQRKAIEDISNVGGTATVNARNQDVLDIILPVKQGQSGQVSDNYLTSILQQAMKYSNAERDMRQQEDKERQEKEDRKREAKESAESKRRTHNLILGAIGVLTLISNLMRRLVTASFAQASADTIRARQAHDLGLTSIEARKYSQAEIRHGLTSGTLLGGAQAFQNAFGNIDNPDESMVKQLAYVLGSGVGDDIKSDLQNGKRPAELMGDALNAALARYEAGYGHIQDKYLGKTDARRDLITWAESISAEFADTLSQMIEDKEKGLFQFTDFSSWLESTTMGGTAPKTLTDYNENYITSFNTQLNEAKANLQRMAEVIQTNVMSSLESLVNKVANIDFGKSAQQKLDDDASRRAFLVGAIAESKVVAATARTKIADVLGVSESSLSLTNLLPAQLSQISSAGLLDEYLRARKAEENIKKYEPQLGKTTPIKDWNMLDFDFASNLKDMMDLANKFYWQGQVGNWDISGTLDKALRASDFSALSASDKDIFSKANKKFFKSLDVKNIKELLEKYSDSAYAKKFAKVYGYEDVASLLRANSTLASLMSNNKYEEALFSALSAEYGFGIQRTNAKNAVEAVMKEVSQKEVFEAQAKTYIQQGMTEDIIKQIERDNATRNLTYSFTPTADHKFLTLKLVGKDNKTYYSKQFAWDSSDDFEGESGAIDWANIVSQN